jgi:hypothetical protein
VCEKTAFGRDSMLEYSAYIVEVYGVLRHLSIVAEVSKYFELITEIGQM